MMLCATVNCTYCSTCCDLSRVYHKYCMLVLVYVHKYITYCLYLLLKHTSECIHVFVCLSECVFFRESVFFFFQRQTLEKKRNANDYLDDDDQRERRLFCIVFVRPMNVSRGKKRNRETRLYLLCCLCRVVGSAECARNQTHTKNSTPTIDATASLPHLYLFKPVHT